MLKIFLSSIEKTKMNNQTPTDMRDLESEESAE